MPDVLNQCSHPDLAECHEGCGHWHCPDCGFSWDDFFEGNIEPEVDYMVSKEDWDDLKTWTES